MWSLVGAFIISLSRPSAPSLIVIIWNSSFNNWGDLCFKHSFDKFWLSKHVPEGIKM